MKKSTRILLIVVILVAALYIIISRKPWSNISSDLKDFSIADTASITKFFLADKRGGKVLLEKQPNGSWLVNNSDPADLQKINLIKSTIHDVEVRNPVTAKEFNAVVANLAANAVKTEIYSEDKLLKTIYVGQATPEGTGTYMIIDGSSSPFVTHIPGFVGYLTPRFLTSPMKWKTKLVFDEDPDQIKEIKVSYSEEEAGNSFIVDNSGTDPVVKTTDGNIVRSPLNLTKYYLASYKNLYLEAYADEVKERESDSIRQTTPFVIIELLRKDGKHKKLTVFRKAIDQRTKERYNEAGERLPFDRDKYFATINDETQLAFIQEYNFGRLFRTAADFANANSK
jgi:hypothetical protein